MMLRTTATAFALATTLLLALAPACTQRKPAGTACEASCVSEGACVDSPAGCIADSDDDCEKSGVCPAEGRCTAKKGLCIAGSQEECQRSELCKTEGACTARAGVCVSGKEGEAPADPAEEPAAEGSAAD
jgi:hypothetical protein